MEMISSLVYLGKGKGKQMWQASKSTGSRSHKSSKDEKAMNRVTICLP